MARNETPFLPLMDSESQSPNALPSAALTAPAEPHVPTAPDATRPGALLFHQVFDRLAKGHRTGLSLFTGAGRTSALALPFAAMFTARGETVAVVEAANNFNLYRLTEWARRNGRAPLELLNRLRIARSFTPFQLAVILEHIGQEMTRYNATRLVVTGLPDCLYDEELTDLEARNTFARCRHSLARLATQTTVLAFAEAPPHAVGGRARFAASLLELAHTAFEVHSTEPVSFAPVKAPGLITVRGEELGYNHSK
ncbi:MAG: hypothetical protein HY316_07100 [Acidobacteria bacterium]|nr:hypothetical protein [Acidobacteriota bacterium]